MKPALETPDTGPTPSPTHVEEPFSIEPRLWSAVDTRSAYEIRNLPDGSPGLFTPRGALVVELLPRVTLDVAPRGKGRTPPDEVTFELASLKPIEGGGFTLFGRAGTDLVDIDLKVEKGPGDPRVHYSVTSEWKRDVTVLRHIVSPRSGAVGRAEALDHDYGWRAIETEWIDVAHTPDIARFTDPAFAIVGLHGVGGLTMRRGGDDRVTVDVELDHYDHHPLELSPLCERELADGASRRVAGTREEARFDVVLGELRAPLVLRWPHARSAAVAIAERGEGDVARVLSAHPTPGRSVSGDTWFGEDHAALPCAEGVGRFMPLARRGISAAWSGEVVGSAGNILRPDDANPRGLFAFRHPDTKWDQGALTFFRLGRATPAELIEALDPPRIADLKSARGLIALRTSLDTLDLQNPGLDVLFDPDRIWTAGAGTIAERLVSLESVELDLLPDGVVRVRNTSTDDIEGLSLLLPGAATARYATGIVHVNANQTTSFDLPARTERMLQLWEGDAPLDTLEPVDVTILPNLRK